MMFWSDIETRKIYQATIGADGTLNPAAVMVDSDLMEVNGLAVDWVANNLYWTDSRKRTIEVFNFVKRTRRVLIMDQLSSPRGIYADPVNGYLFWDDQGKERIERSRLDGSEREVIVSNQTWPNQLVVSSGRLYWVNSAKKTLESSALDGSDTRVVSNLTVLANGKNIFGLAISGGVAYVTNWVYNQLITVRLTDGANPRVTAKLLGSDLLFSALYYSREVQPAGIADPCATAGCSHLCFPRGDNTARCSCPSYGGLVLRGSTCEGPPLVFYYYFVVSSMICRAEVSVVTLSKFCN
jgi:hypothetical protein